MKTKLNTIDINGRKFIIQNPVLGVLADLENEFDCSFNDGNVIKVLQEKCKKISNAIKLVAIVIKDADKPYSEKDLQEVTDYIREFSEPADLEKVMAFFLTGSPKIPKKPLTTSKDTAKTMELINVTDKK